MEQTVERTPIGTWDFNGSGGWSSDATTSVAFCQLQRYAKNGNEVWKGAILRIRGFSCEGAKMAAAAQKVVDWLNSQKEYTDRIFEKKDWVCEEIRKKYNEFIRLEYR